MISRRTARRLTLALALVAPALVQGCAATTGPYLATKSTVSNRSMTSQFDVLRRGARSSMYQVMPATRAKGLFDHRYY